MLVTVPPEPEPSSVQERPPVEMEYSEELTAEIDRVQTLVVNQAEEYVAIRGGEPAVYWVGARWKVVFFPEFRLDFPAAQAANVEIEQYLAGIRPENWEEEWDFDYAWFEAYQFRNILSTAIRYQSIFGGIHILQSWNFDLETGELLGNAALLDRLGVSPDLFNQAAREPLLELVNAGREDVLSWATPGTLTYDQADDNCALFTAIINASDYLWEQWYLIETDDEHNYAGFELAPVAECAPRKLYVTNDGLIGLSAQNISDYDIEDCNCGEDQTMGFLLNLGLSQ